MSGSRVFRLDPLDRDVLFGLTRRQLAMVTFAVVVFLASTITRRHELASGITAAVVVVVAVVPIGGATLIEAIPTMAGWLATRPRRWSRPLHLLTAGADPALPSLPSWLAGLDLTVVGAGGAIGNASAATTTVLVPIAGRGFTTRDSSRMSVLLDGWSQLYTSSAVGEDVVRVCWTDIARPAVLDGHQEWVGDQRDGPDRATRDYHQFVADQALVRHDQVVAVTVHRGHRDETPAAGDRVAAIADLVDDTLTGAGIDTGGIATVEEIAWLLRSSLDPTSAPAPPHGTTTGSLVQRLGLVPVAGAGPMRVEVARDRVAVDAVCHRSWWVEQWPSRDLPPDWFDPFLSTVPAAARQRLVTMVAEPQPFEVAARELNNAVAGHGGDRLAAGEGRTRWDSWKQRKANAVAARERELEAGHSPLAYAVIVTVTADPDRLDAASREFERHARRHKVQVRRLWGRMHLGLAASLPLGLGLSRVEPR